MTTGKTRLITVPGLLLAVLLAAALAAPAARAQEAEAPAPPPVATESAVDEDPALEMAQDSAFAADAASPSQEAAAKIQELRRNEFFYQSEGRVDPFKILVAGKFESLESSDLVDIGSGHLVGVMWGPDDQFALVEDGNGFGYILRVGDPVQNGRVVSIRKNSLTAKVTLYGITSTVNLKLEKSEG